MKGPTGRKALPNIHLDFIKRLSLSFMYRQRPADQLRLRLCGPNGQREKAHQANIRGTCFLLATVISLEVLISTPMAATSISGGGGYLQYLILANRTTGYLTFRGASKKLVIVGSGIFAI